MLARQILAMSITSTRASHLTDFSSMENDIFQCSNGTGRVDVDSKPLVQRDDAHVDGYRSASRGHSGRRIDDPAALHQHQTLSPLLFGSRSMRRSLGRSWGSAARCLAGKRRNGTKVGAILMEKVEMNCMCSGKSRITTRATLPDRGTTTNSSRHLLQFGVTRPYRLSSPDPWPTHLLAPLLLGGAGPIGTPEMDVALLSILQRYNVFCPLPRPP